MDREVEVKKVWMFGCLRRRRISSEDADESIIAKASDLYRVYVKWVGPS